MVEYDGLDAFEAGFTQKFNEAEAQLMTELTKSAKETWTGLAHERLNATADHYAERLQVARDEDAVVVTVPAGIPSAVDAGSNQFNLAKGFFAPRTKTLLLERSPGNIRWKPIWRNGRKKMIPLDGGWPEKQGGTWNHPGIAPRNISTDALEKVRQDVIPGLIKDFVSKVTV